MSIFLIRHAQSQFNAVYDPEQPDPMIFDARLTDLGQQQAIEAREEVQQLPVEQLIVSPFTRTLQTASLMFEDRLPVRIDAQVREQLVNSCDVGRAPDELAVDYPHLDFQHLEVRWWHDGEPDHRGFAVEPHAVLQARANAFVQLLKSQGAHSTAIVTHGNFIRAVTGVQPANCQILQLDLS
ncbi:MAG: histidine phosphatase family protein [Rhizobiaceae bacterium]